MPVESNVICLTETVEIEKKFPFLNGLPGITLVPNGQADLSYSQC